MLITYYDLQVQKSIIHYRFGLPINVEIYLGEVRSVVDFESLKPKSVMDFFGIEIDVGFLDPSKLGGTNAVYMNTYLVYAIIFVVTIFVLLVLLLFGVVFKKYKEKIIELVNKTKDKFIWNGIIQSISIAYLNQAVGLFLIYDMLFNKEFLPQDYPGLIISFFILIYLLCYIGIIGRFTWKNKERLAEPKFNEKIIKMYPDVYLNKMDGQQYFYLVFIGRRFVFALLTLISEKHVLFQLVLLLILQISYAGFIMQRKTFKFRGMNNIIIINEVVSVIQFDMLIIYTGSLYNSGLEQFYFRYAYLSLLGFKVLLNMIYIST